MKLGIMQPYFLPYIGYWQLINKVDKYVVYDDVNFIKGGWINRNRAVINGKVQYINIQMIGASSFKKINEVTVNNSNVWKENFLNSIEMSYSKAEYFNEAYKVLEEIIYCNEENLAKFLFNSIKCICNYLDIRTELLLSSDVEQDRTLHAQDRVINICKNLKADEYINAIGGQELYSKEIFADNNVSLNFLKTELIEYTQFSNEFVGSLSIVDVMMFNSKENIKKMLDLCSLV